SQQRQKYIFNFIYQIFEAEFEFSDKDQARNFFQSLRQLFRGWNSCAWESAEFKNSEAELSVLIKKHLSKKEDSAIA
ncbi:hypothetical protein ACFL2I_05245, partial [Candidatus Omnitrophota bacterium]